MRTTLLRLPLLAGLLLAGQPQAFAAASILIWPIDPVIEDNQQATALWLENRDSKPVYMQIRVLGWQQTGGKDDYRNQSEVLASPPVATILPGKRQLIRLISRRRPPPDKSGLTASWSMKCRSKIKMAQRPTKARRWG